MCLISVLFWSRYQCTVNNILHLKGHKKVAKQTEICTSEAHIDYIVRNSLSSHVSDQSWRCTVTIICQFLFTERGNYKELLALIDSVCSIGQSHNNTVLSVKGRSMPVTPHSFSAGKLCVWLCVRVPAFIFLSQGCKRSTLLWQLKRLNDLQMRCTDNHLVISSAL